MDKALEPCPNSVDGSHLWIDGEIPIGMTATYHTKKRNSTGQPPKTWIVPGMALRIDECGHCQTRRAVAVADGRFGTTKGESMMGKKMGAILIPKSEVQ